METFDVKENYNIRETIGSNEFYKVFFVSALLHTHKLLAII